MIPPFGCKGLNKILFHEPAVSAFGEALRHFRKVVRSIHQLMDCIMQHQIFFRSVFDAHEAVYEPVGGENHQAGKYDRNYDLPFMYAPKRNPFF